MARRQPLVCQHLEDVSRAALQKHSAVIADFVQGRRGVYALYRHDRLYYVGLATNLRTRLKNHLRGRHSKGWDRFSVYLTIGDSHLRELEALVLRIVQPKGNKQKGKFAKSENLKAKMRRVVRENLNREVEDLLGQPAWARNRKTKRRGSPSPKEAASELARLIRGPLRLRARYRGHTYTARVRRDGRIRFQGKVYTSPTGAAKVLLKRPCSGWWFWEVEQAPGDWVKLKELRR